MSVWTWILIALCAAGLVLVLVSIALVLVRVLRLRARIAELKRARLFVYGQSLREQADRLSAEVQRTKPLLERASAAVASMQSSASQLRDDQARESIEEMGAQVAALIEDLR